MMLKEGLTHTNRLAVTEVQTIQVIGSGGLSVLVMSVTLVLTENAVILVVVNELEEGQTTVGGHISSPHLKSSKVGAMVETTTTLTKVDRRKLFFHVVARQDGGVIGEGDHLCFVVDK